MNSRETRPTFRIEAQRNVVLVRVVVRDSKGQAVGNLHKEDFKLLDNRKPQIITHFAVEVPLSKRPTGVTPGQQEMDTEAGTGKALAPSPPQRYLALYFDDVHMAFEDVARTRDAADHYLAGALQPGDRVGVFTSSGQTVLDFTDDRPKLREALSRLLPRPVVPMRENTCPEIFDYQAYLIVHQHDIYAIDIATEEAYHCYCENLPRIPPDCRGEARRQAETEAMQVLNSFETQSEYALRGLEQLARRIGVVPGQRSIVLVSPGFLTLTQESRVEEIVERALRSNVIINTLDAKGLFAVIPLGDASRRPMVLTRRPDLTGNKVQIQLNSMQRQSDVLAELAADTGGVFFHNSNDLDEGFRKVGALPEVYYVLAFSPQNLKLDGRFHSLKVNLASSGRLAVQARRGYFAPTKPLDATSQAKEEIEQALFSQDELNELPIDVHTQFFKLSGRDTRLSVLTHVDLRLIRFRKQEGRNRNNLTFVTGLFDRDGKYVTGKEKLLELRLRDGSLERLSQSGVTIRNSFDVEPGTYLVRQVVRDAEGGQISGLNRTVEIPF